MEDSFKVRVDKIFGSLGGNAPSSAGISPSLWSLTDEEVERRQWDRKKEEDEEGEGEGDDTIERGGMPDMRDQFEEDLRDLSDLEEEEEEEEEYEEGKEEEGIDFGKKKRRKSGDIGTILDENWDVQANIGRDCTLDYEEEEDEYDKVAVGTEQSGDRLYMRDVKYADYGIDEVNTFGELPISFHSVVRDPRANHLAAKNRLKEDAEASQNFDYLHLSDNYAARSVEAEDLEKGDSGADNNPKPILKKRENVMDSRPQKRVRFSFDTKSGCDSEEQVPSETCDSASEQCSRNDIAVPGQISNSSDHSSAIPDYVRNPSRYTRYTLDSTDGDMDDQANQKPHPDFLQYVRKEESDDMPGEDVDILTDNPTAVMFTLKKKPEVDSGIKSAESNVRENLMNTGLSIGADDIEMSRMEGDDPSEVGGLQKPGRQVRQYRSRVNPIVDYDDEDNSDSYL